MAERSAASRSRAGAVRAARDHFYRGDIAQEIADFCRDKGGFLTAEDLGEFHVMVEPPQRGSYKALDVYTCGFWCQGPALIQIPHILEGMDIGGLGHNSAGYLHMLVEAIKLVFSDRHSYYGDPEFVDVPADGLLSKKYAALRRTLIDDDRAWPEMPPAGDPVGMNSPRVEEAVATLDGGAVDTGRQDEGGTAQLCVVDRWGNAFSATPSDLTVHAPLVPGLGVGISPRGAQAWLETFHPSCLEAWKRPRLTPNPSLALTEGKVAMAFGTPSVDAQVQAITQMLLNVVEFDMDPQQAVEAPRRGGATGHQRQSTRLQLAARVLPGRRGPRPAFPSRP